MKAKPYPKTKPSGVEWLGDVPEHWDSVSLRRYSTRYSGGTPDRNNEAYWDEGTIPWINSGAVNQGLVVEPSAFITEEAFQNSSAKWVSAGALVMALAGQGKTKGMVAQMGFDSTCNQSMAAICPKPPVQARYLYWLLVSQYEHIRNMAGGEARDGLNLEILGDIPCLKLPPAEQTAIAAFLDRETGRVDRLVAKKRELIERLKEKRGALISRTVTRGLPPAAAKAAGLPVNSSFKSSGHPWLDDIPSHWNVKRLKEVSVLVGRIGFRGYSTEDLVYEGEGAISMSPSNMADGVVSLDKCTWLSWEKYCESPEIQVQPGDIIMVKTGSTIGKTAFVDSVPVPMTINPQLMIFKEVKCSQRFLFYLLFSKVIQDVIPLHNTGSTIPTMTQEGIGKLPFPQPPLPEQTAIAAYLDAETSKLDALVAKVEEAVERLQEYRSALITAAVTGKIDVRKEIPA
jgi:type I restriction enzyme S subunit